MLAAYPQCSTLPPHQLHDHPYRPMLARVRSYTPPGSRRVADSKCAGSANGRDRACSCERSLKANGIPLPLRRCASEGGYTAATTPWTRPPPVAEASCASGKVETPVEEPELERRRKVPRPSFDPPVKSSNTIAADGARVAVPKQPCAAAAETAVDAPPIKQTKDQVLLPSGKLDRASILAPRQLAALDGLCHDIGMAEDPNERWRERHEDTAIVLLRLHRTARVGTSESGGVLVPQRTKTTTRARSSSTGHMQPQQDQQRPPPSPIMRQRSQGPPTGLVRQKSTRPQRKCRSMTDVYGMQRQQQRQLQTLAEQAQARTHAASPASPLGSPSDVSTGSASAATSMDMESPAAGASGASGASGGLLSECPPLLEQEDMIFAGLFDGHGTSTLSTSTSTMYYALCTMHAPVPLEAARTPCMYNTRLVICVAAAHI